MRFEVSTAPIDPAALRAAMADARAGGFVSFEGWVRDLNEGRAVLRLEYEAFAPLAEKEGARILEEAGQRFEVFDIVCVHRTGLLELGELAVWVGGASRHRAAAFDACRFVIDEVKTRVPIWKKEHYADGDSGWVNCHALPERDG
ncbi:MAG: molybdenum cofactor biosynthesis protein MoaE [Opitutaceae bacterium]